MPIEINGQSNNQPITTKEGGASLHVIHNKKAPAQQQETGKSSALDTVSLTDTAALLQRMEATIANASVVDTQRVEDIRKSIANGSFEINAPRVAEKMLGFEARLK